MENSNNDFDSFMHWSIWVSFDTVVFVVKITNSNLFLEFVLNWQVNIMLLQPNCSFHCQIKRNCRNAAATYSFEMKIQFKYISSKFVHENLWLFDYCKIYIKYEITDDTYFIISFHETQSNIKYLWHAFLQTREAKINNHDKCKSEFMNSTKFSNLFECLH